MGFRYKGAIRNPSGSEALTMGDNIPKIDWLGTEAQTPPELGMGDNAVNNAATTMTSSKVAEMAPAMVPESGLSQAGSLTTAAGAASMNPQIAAAGLALQAMGQIQQAKQANRNAKYTAKVNQVKARQDAIDRMSQIGQNLRA